MPASISRAAYADMFGPTTGDKLRLADTDLIIEVEKDLTTYGEEVKFGGGKVIRDGMGQSQATRAEGAVDTVITNAVILDLLTEEELASFGEQVSTEQGRAQLSLHMLMSSVEEAPNLAAESQAPALAPLKPSPASPPHMKLVPNQGPGTS